VSDAPGSTAVSLSAEDEDTAGLSESSAPHASAATAKSKNKAMAGSRPARVFMGSPRFRRVTLLRAGGPMPAQQEAQ
jgi:hypothetical protein